MRPYPVDRKDFQVDPSRRPREVNPTGFGSRQSEHAQSRVLNRLDFSEPSDVPGYPQARRERECQRVHERSAPPAASGLQDIQMDSLQSELQRANEESEVLDRLAAQVAAWRVESNEERARLEGENRLLVNELKRLRLNAEVERTAHRKAAFIEAVQPCVDAQGDLSRVLQAVQALRRLLGKSCDAPSLRCIFTRKQTYLDAFHVKRVLVPPGHRYVTLDMPAMIQAGAYATLLRTCSILLIANILVATEIIAKHLGMLRELLTLS
jgi:hypothetical protein